MVLLSANLGFLWTDRPLPDAVRAAADAGFDAVECHFPYEVDPSALTSALEATGLPLLGLNTAPGSTEAGAAGLAAVPGHEAEARTAIDQALAYAATVDARHVHVMAGRAAGSEARRTFVTNLTYATEQAAEVGTRIVIEPINQRDMPGYFLSTVEEAAGIITDVLGPDSALPTLSPLAMMFDCYHVQIGQGDLLRRFQAHLPLIGHVQFAGVPDRAEPDQSEIDYAWLLPQFAATGYDGFFGAEYRPRTTTDAGLAWLPHLRSPR